jgi:tetratricopeptide (TPR) repeat protein
MGFFKLFAGRSPEDVEKRADSLFEAGKYGLARMEYDHGLDTLEKGAQASEALRERLQEKLRRTKEILAQTHKQEGQETMDSDYYKAAEDSFRTALDLTENPELIQELQDLLSEIKRRSGNRQADPARDPHPLSADDPTRAGPEAGDDERFEALCSSLPEPLAREFHRYGISFRQGYLALNEGDFEQAADKLLQAMEENPSGEFIAIELATAYLNLENYQEALGLAKRFVDDHPDSPQGYQVLCEALWALREFDTALKLLETCPPILADSIFILLLRGETLLKARRFEEAEHLLKRELDSQGWQPDIARSLAVVLEAQGNRAEARDLYKALLAACRSCGSPGDTFAKQRFADLSLEQGEYSSAVLELYLALAQEDPSHRADYYRKVSRIYAAQGNNTEAGRFEAFARQAQRGSSGS